MSKKCAISARHRVSPVQRRSLTAVFSASDVDRRPDRLRVFGVEHEAIGELGEVFSVSRLAAAPPDERRQARQPQRRHGVVDERAAAALRGRSRTTSRAPSASPRSPLAMRIARMPPASACGLNASAASTSRAQAPTATTVAVRWSQGSRRRHRGRSPAASLASSTQSRAKRRLDAVRKQLALRRSQRPPAPAVARPSTPRPRAAPTRPLRRWESSPPLRRPTARAPA